MKITLILTVAKLMFAFIKWHSHTSGLSPETGINSKPVGNPVIMASAFGLFCGGTTSIVPLTPAL